jgi:pilus assembly protein FimV
MDLDLDFSLDDDNSSAISDMRSTEQTTRLPAVESGPPPLDMDLPTIDAPGAAVAGNEIDFDLPDISTAPSPEPVSSGDIEDFSRQAAVSFGSTAPAPLATDASKAPAPPAEESGMLEFDLGSLSLDLGDSTEGTSAPASAATAATPEDPLATKLALAEEFSAIGDDDGARALIEEVISEAAGDMKARAQQALAKLG